MARQQPRTVEDFVASIPAANRWKLDKQIDSENRNAKGEIIPRHLGRIADSMVEWEDRIADELGLSEQDRIDIAEGRNKDKPVGQRYVHRSGQKRFVNEQSGP